MGREGYSEYRFSRAHAANFCAITMPLPPRITSSTSQLALLFVFLPGLAWSSQQFPVKGLVLKIDKFHQEMVVSCQSIPGYMEAMAMPFSVRDAKELEALRPGTMIEFTLVVDKDAAHAENIQIHGFQNLELDPTEARRLALLNGALKSSPSKTLSVGQSVPDFALTDQSRQTVKLSQFVGKIVVINFMYTRCPFPNYCFRLSNNLGQLQKRFPQTLGLDLVLLSITFDPVHDQPEVLAKYGATWHANLKEWHFLTGPLPDIQRVSQQFGMDFWPDEALMIHGLHTVIIDRKGKLAANLEGNEFTAAQLGDLVQTMLVQQP
jgi:protein SCO1